MKTYNIIKVDGKEICYRVYGSRTGRGIEVASGTCFTRRETVKEFFGWWKFDPIKEAKRLYRQCLGGAK